MRLYEIMYLLSPKLDAKGIKEQRTNLEGIITKNGGKITKETIWGLMKTAYPIKKHHQAYYVIIEAQASPYAIDEFNRLAKINKDELRHMIINLDQTKIKKEVKND